MYNMVYTRMTLATMRYNPWAPQTPLYAPQTHNQGRNILLVRLVDVSQDLSSGVLPPGLFVVHDSSRGGEDDLSERTGGQEQVDPVLDCNCQRQCQ